jgi:hypothetical protein
MARAMWIGKINSRCFAQLSLVRDAVRELLSVRMDAMARKFNETHDTAVKDEIYRLAREYGKIKKPWVFNP